MAKTRSGAVAPEVRARHGYRYAGALKHNVLSSQVMYDCATDTDVGRRSSRILSGLMHKAGAPVALIPTLIFASSAMIAGADLEFSGQEARGSLSGKTQLPRELDMTMFLEANELVLLGIEALIKQHRERE